MGRIQESIRSLEQAAQAAQAGAEVRGALDAWRASARCSAEVRQAIEYLYAGPLLAEGLRRQRAALAADVVAAWGGQPLSALLVALRRGSALCRSLAAAGQGLEEQVVTAQVAEELLARWCEDEDRAI